MSGLAIVYTLFGDAEEARRTSRQLVEERLAACANILAPCTSVYEWEGAVREEAEHPVLFKTPRERRDALIARLKALHSYEVPAILSWDAEATDAYRVWAAGQTIA